MLSGSSNNFPFADVRIVQSLSSHEFFLHVYLYIFPTKVTEFYAVRWMRILETILTNVERIKLSQMVLTDFESRVALPSQTISTLRDDK